MDSASTEPIDIDISGLSDIEQQWYRKLGERLGRTPGEAACYHVGMHLYKRGRDYSEYFPHETPENRKILCYVMDKVLNHGEKFPDI